MSDSKTKSGIKARRIARLERELTMLETMDATLWWRIIVCTLGVIAGLSSGMLAGLVLSGHALSWGTAGFAVLGVLALLLVIRFWRPLLWAVAVAGVLLLIALIIDGVDDVFWPDPPGTDAIPSDGCAVDASNAFDLVDIGPGEKSKHRRRIERAIARRRARLARLLAG